MDPRPDDYAFLDCGDGRRLERFGPVVVSRPAPAATWAPGLPASDWASAGLSFDRERGWSGEAPLPDPWEVSLPPVRLGLRPAAGGQVGAFPEHAVHWQAIAAALQAAGRPIRLLNAFASTGGATLAACLPGVEVCHVDASRAAVDQARRNAARAGLQAHPVRWIVDDALGFLEREVRRGRTYDALVLDPPAFGRGRGSATWKLERDLPRLVDVAARLLSPAPLFLLVTCHPTGWTAADLARHLDVPALAHLGPVRSGTVTLQPSSGGRPLPAGLWARRGSGPPG